jgi:hypothetical protein
VAFAVLVGGNGDGARWGEVATAGAERLDIGIGVAALEFNRPGTAGRAADGDVAGADAGETF